ncbi:AMP-binding protein [Comamonadaceae bacterium G21597-S1]|nr:AMP-binding protein [Comamonadaceae bacterium G21597-S1]
MVHIAVPLQERTIGQVVTRQAELMGDKVFLTFTPDGRTFTYRQLDLLSNRLANGLMAHGVEQGAHVAVMMENSPEQLLLFLALGKVGAVVVPINTAARGAQLRHLVELSDASFLVVDASLQESNIADGQPPPPAVKCIVIAGEDPTAPGKAIPGVNRVPFADLEQHSDAPIAVRARFRDLAFLSYTSGTTGPSKLNMFPHAHCLGYAANNAQEHDYRPEDIAYVCLPMFHVSALFGVTLAAMLAGSSIVMTRRFSMSRFWSDIRDYKITLVNALGAMSDFIMNQPPSPEDRTHSVRLCRMVPVPRYGSEFEARFGVKLVSGYGLSDFGQITAFTAQDPRDKLGSAGRPRRGIEMRIVDDDDLDVPAGEPGEIIVRSNNMWNTSLGYYKMPEATLAALGNLWFHTGDRGRLDADGYLYFVGRKKDAIRRRGENISCVEVEQVIAKHPAVGEVAVYPVQAEMSEEEVAASIVAKPGHTVTELEIVEYCRQNMAYYMVPRFIRLVDDLPRTLSHRVQKFLLVEQAQRDLSSLFDREAAGIVLRRESARV